MSQTTARTIALFLFIFSFKLTFGAAPPPSNDDCGGAVVLTLGVINTNGTVKAANASTGIPIGTCTGTPDDDVWYKFTLSSTTSITVTLSSIGGNLSASGAMVQLLSGTCSPLSFSSIACGNTEISAANLTSGTYYIRVYSAGNTAINSGDGFSIIVTGPPSNDDCVNAVTLTNGVTNTSGTVWNATASSSSVPVGCATGNPDDDVWYKFTATTTIATIDLSSVGSDLSASGAMIQMFTGTCPSGFISYACGNTSLTTSVTNGTTYYVRIYSSGTGSIGSTSPGSAFSITVTFSSPPSNDDCSGAVTLSTGVTNSSGTVWNASASGSIPTGCATGTPDDDVWYKITSSSAGSDLAIALSGVGTELNNSGAMVQVFSGSCGSLTSVACGTSSLSTQVGVGTYYIRIYSSGAGSIGGTSSGSAFSITATVTAPVIVTAGRMNEVYKQTILSGSGVLQYPWEVTYGPDSMLWITEARGYKVYRMNPSTGSKTTVLDLNSASTDLSAWGADSLRAVNLTSQTNWNATANNWPQGGLAGLAIHPNFGDGSGHDFVYISYVHRYLSTASGSAGIFFRNKIVRFTYNSGTGKLGSPAVVCDTIPGGQDHNSQRMIIAPVTPGGTNYLFYAAGDMGAGQYGNRMRPENAQYPSSYEGKILRFNLESDGQSGADGWIPDSNPYNALLGVQSAVYSIGIRNNQGFAYDTATNKLYGASHGPYSDDEINIIESFRNYGHPLIEGFVDGNYNGNTVQGTTTSYSAGAGWNDNSGVSTCPPIGNEATNKALIDASGNGLYKDPLFSAYAAPLATVANIWTNNIGGNPTSPTLWPTEAWSGLDIYNNKIVPGWKHSLVAASLKLGRLVRLKLGAAGSTTMPNNNESDTISYFNSKNRFRDLAFSPDGKDLFVIMDNSSTTSGPGNANPVVPTCAGCVQKYTFLGYADASGKSSIPTSIDVTDGTVNTCNTGTTVTIDATNSNYWVPITGPDGNIMAEIYANGNNLGTVTSSFYKNSGVIRIKNSNHYLDRNMTITPQTQPSTPVKIRLYISKAELDALIADGASGVSSISNLKILKNSDACGNSISATTTLITPTYAEAHGTNGYMLQGSISSFSSFYFSSSNITLPLDLLSFIGVLQNNNTLLKWRTANEVNVSRFQVERSTDGTRFNEIGAVSANGNNIAGSVFDYSFTDIEAGNLPSLILYYRLRIVDIDGSFKYSNIVSVSLGAITGKLSVSPNPVINQLKVNISSPTDGRIQWKLFDNTGRVVLQNAELVRKGDNTFTIMMNKLSKGSYYLSVSGTIDQKIKLQKL